MWNSYESNIGSSPMDTVVTFSHGLGLKLTLLTPGAEVYDCMKLYFLSLTYSQDIVLLHRNNFTKFM